MHYVTFERNFIKIINYNEFPFFLCMIDYCFGVTGSAVSFYKELNGAHVSHISHKIQITLRCYVKTYIYVCPM
jgi:hypothetical protein